MHANKKIKIAIIASSFPPFGGGGVVSSHYNLYNLFKSKGYAIKAFTFVDIHKERNDGIHRTSLPSIFDAIIRLIIFTIFRLLGEKGIIFQLADAVVGCLSGLLLIRPIRKFGPDIIILPDQGASSALWPRFKKSKTFLVSHHNPVRFLGEPLIGLHSEKDARWAIRLEEIALKKIDVVICPSLYMKDVFVNTYHFNGSIEVIPNVIDFECIQNIGNSSLQCELRAKTEFPVIYIPSAGSPYKGKQFVFEIIRRIARGYGEEIGFYLTGDIDADLKRQLDFIPTNARIISQGNLPYKTNIENIALCTLCLSPTLIENFGMAILEAQYCGLPVITFDVGGNKEIVENDKTGYLLPIMDIDGLIEKALYMLANKDACTKMGECAHSHSGRRFAVDTIFSKYTALFVNVTR
jgi:glycosyltransferase involved in cell wall biosynthesis